MFVNQASPAHEMPQMSYSELSAFKDVRSQSQGRKNAFRSLQTVIDRQTPDTVLLCHCAVSVQTRVSSNEAGISHLLLQSSAAWRHEWGTAPPLSTGSGSAGCLHRPLTDPAHQQRILLSMASSRIHLPDHTSASSLYIGPQSEAICRSSPRWQPTLSSNVLLNRFLQTPAENEMQAYTEDSCPDTPV